MRTLAALAAACGPTAATPIHNERAPDGILIAENGVGPLDGKTHITLTSMQQLFPAYAITTERSNSSTLYNVMNGRDKLLYVVANDDGSVYGVHVTSGSIANPSHAWRVGGKLAAGVIDACECWGSPSSHDEVATCYKTGEHVAVVFERPCSGLLTTADERAQLAGATIARVVWQPNPWGQTGTLDEGM